MIKLFLSFSCAFLCIFTIQAQLSIDAQIRPRAEFRNGFKTLTVEDRKPAFFIEQRSRLKIDFKKEKLTMRITMQDVRIWGGTNQIYKTDIALFNVFEAWGQYQMSKNWALKFGRMPLSYDTQRFLGGLGWAQQARSHDLAQIKYKNDSIGVSIDLGAAFNQQIFEPTALANTTYLGVNNYKTIQYIYAQKKFNKGYMALLAHNDGRFRAQGGRTFFRQTLGINGARNAEKYKVGGEFYWQGGKSGADNVVNALMAAAYFTYKLDKVALTLGGDYLSGTETDQTDDNSFQPLYGTNHKFYGYMDYFYVGNGHGQGGKTAGLIDLYLKAKITTSTKSNLQAHVHAFSSPVDIVDARNRTADSYLGTEVDLVFTKKLSKDVKFNIGYSQMFGTESLELIKAAPGDRDQLNNWAWFMIDFNTEIFNSKSKS